LATLKAVLDEVKQDLMQKDKIRDETHEDMRKATSLSKQAILLMHQKKQAEAEKMVKEATEKITNLQTLAKQYPEIIYGGMFSAALQEYAEANIFLTLIKKQIRYIQEINVPSIDFTLGLADVVGEYRRLALDALREGDAKKGEECLQIMDEIFIDFSHLMKLTCLVPGLRRKSDIARKIIETTRGDITQEVRRNRLRTTLNVLSQKKKLKNQKEKRKSENKQFFSPKSA
jgi:translin